MQGVTWKPRQKYAGFKFNREPLKFECLFESVVEYEGWLEFNRLKMNSTVDMMSILWMLVTTASLINNNNKNKGR